VVHWLVSLILRVCYFGSTSNFLKDIPITNNGYRGTSPTLPSSNIQLSATVSQVFANVASNNVYPAVGSALIGAGDATHSTAVDFNGLTRGNPPTIGAYVRDLV
jgi:hypothetical protein